MAPSNYREQYVRCMHQNTRTLHFVSIRLLEDVFQHKWNKVHIDNCSKSVNLANATIPIYRRAVKCWVIQRRLTYFGCWNKLFIEPDVWSFGKKVHLSQKWLQNFNRPDRSKKWTQNSIWREKNKRLIITVARSPEFSNR